MRARIGQALRELPLSDQEVARIAPPIADTFLLRQGSFSNPDSTFFDFRHKIEAVAQRFAPYNLTLEDYLGAAISQPQLFCESPATIIANIEGVAGHFRGHSLRISLYLRTAISQPQLFCQPPPTIIANIEGVARNFRCRGLTIGDYLRAAIKRPQLFCQPPPTIIANIEGVARNFRYHGLTISDYLRAAVRRPQIFCQSPATIIANIEGVPARFRDDGLALSDYLRAAVRQPPLFCQSPPTIIRHVERIIDLHRLGFVTFSRTHAATPAQPLKPMFAFLVKNPQFFCLSDDNYALREAYAHITGKRFAGTSLLTRSRHQIEWELAKLHGSIR
jgi:hypothetical protein